MGHDTQACVWSIVTSENNIEKIKTVEKYNIVF